MVLSVTLNPSVDHALFVDELLVGDTNRVKRVETDAGGKGVNLSRVLCELGGTTVATGFLGGAPGAYVTSVLDGQGVAHAFVTVAGDTRTNFSVEDVAKNRPTTFNQSGPQISEENLNELLDRVRERLPQIRWLAMGGSLPPGVPKDIFKTLVLMAHEAWVKSLVDADGEPMRLAMEAKPDFIKPNDREATRLLSREVATRNDALKAATDLYRQLGGGDRIVVISRGAGGAVLACREGLYDGVSPSVEMRSTIGCGDSMLGGMLAAMYAEKDVVESFSWGLAAGAATAATDGTEIARRGMVDELLPKVKVERDFEGSLMEADLI